MFLRILKNMNKIAAKGCFIVSNVIIIIVLMQLIARYSFDYGLPWAEELSGYLQIWLTFLGVCMIFETSGHVTVKFFVNKFSPKMQLISKLFVQLLVVLFLILLIYKGFFMVNFVWSSHSSMAGIPMGLIYLAVPACSILMLLNVLNITIGLIKKSKMETN